MAPRSESNTRNPPSEGRRRSAVGVGRLAPVSGVEPLRSVFVARSPKSLGPRAKWMWRVDLHHHRQVYETCAPLFVLRHRSKWCLEKCSHLRLFLFREALALSQLSRRNWCARPELNWHALKHSPLKTACLPIPPRAQSADVPVPVSRSGRTGAAERSRTVPCFVGNDAAHHARIGSCHRICTYCLRLIRSVLILMSFAAAIGQDGRICTCGFRVPGSAVCC